jgi:hypothetical protein
MKTWTTTQTQTSKARFLGSGAQEPLADDPDSTAVDPFPEPDGRGTDTDENSAEGAMPPKTEIKHHDGG